MLIFNIRLKRSSICHKLIGIGVDLLIGTTCCRVDFYINNGASNEHKSRIFASFLLVRRIKWMLV